jgi:hypothetical protein
LARERFCAIWTRGTKFMIARYASAARLAGWLPLQASRELPS